MTEQTNTPRSELVEQYRQELLNLYRQQPAPSTENWLDRQYPEPNILKDKAALSPDPPMEEPPVENSAEPPPIAPTPFIGYLRVFAVTASGAEPIEGARVTVSGGDTIYAETVTDRDGYTQVIPLPTVDPALSLKPNNPAPYVTYTVLTEAEGFGSVRHRNLPVYGNDYVTQTVMLMPLTPGDDPNAVQEFTSGAPTNL